MVREVGHDNLAHAALQRRARQSMVIGMAEADERAVVRPSGSVRTNESRDLVGATASGTYDHDRPTVVAVLRLQRTHSNQAMQRLLQDNGASLVQRDDELLPNLTVGDYKIGPPKPTLETDDSQDTHDGRTRATQTERGRTRRESETGVVEGQTAGQVHRSQRLVRSGKVARTSEAERRGGDWADSASGGTTTGRLSTPSPGRPRGRRICLIDPTTRPRLPTRRSYQ
jgi:hypothetical protein